MRLRPISRENLDKVEFYLNKIIFYSNGNKRDIDFVVQDLEGNYPCISLEIKKDTRHFLSYIFVNRVKNPFWHKGNFIKLPIVLSRELESIVEKFLN